MLSADNNPAYGASPALIKAATGTPDSTIRRWKKHPETIPESAARLIRFAMFGDLKEIAGDKWKDFSICNGKFFAPYFRNGFTPMEIAAMFFQMQELHQTRREIKQLQEENALLKKNAEKYRAMITRQPLRDLSPFQAKRDQEP